MDTGHEKLVMAYLDGELSAAEAAALDSALSDGQRTNLSSEIRFEHAIGERLSRGAACPEDVWRRTVAMVEARASAARGPLDRKAWVRAAIAVAAMVAIALAGRSIWSQLGLQASPLLAIDSHTSVRTLQNEVELAGHDTNQVNLFFQEHGFNVAMTTGDVQADTGRHRPRVLLGMRPETHHGDAVMELMFDCCGRPLKVVVAKMGTETAREIGEGVADGKIQGSKRIGDYVAALVGRHESMALLDYFIEPKAAA